MSGLGRSVVDDIYHGGGTQIIGRLWENGNRVARSVLLTSRRIERRLWRVERRLWAQWAG